jgi:LuxR family glucitol operon transcriptional activator
VDDHRHNLPRRWLEIFVGREQDLQAINRWLWSSSSVCLITGWAGMGKSTLALETAYACVSDSHGVAGKFKWPVFSSVIWISAEPKQLVFSDFLDTIAYQLGRVELLEKSLVEKRLVVRNALAAAAMQLPIFLIIDSVDTADAEIYEFVANMPQGIKVLMTARENPSTLHALTIRDMDIISLVGLKDSEALEYLQKEVTHQWNLSNLPVKKQRLKDLLEEKTEVLLQLISATAGNPKAISLSVAYMIDDDLSPNQLVGEIEKASYSLSTLFNYLFGRTWERCSDDAKRLWQTLGFFDKSPVEESWSKIAGLDAKRFHAALEQLKSFALVETERSQDTIQYRAHQTVLSYGVKRLVENEELEQELCKAWADYYIDYLDRHLKRPQLDEPYWKFLIERDLDKVKVEWPNILKLLNWAGDHEDSELLIEIMLRISHYLSRINFTIRIKYGLKAAEAARDRGDARLAALFYIDTVGWALIESGNHAEGLRQIEIGLKLVEELRDDRPEVQELIVLGQVFKARYCLNTNQLNRAEHILGQLTMLPQSPIIQHRLLLVQGELCSIRGNYAEAVDLYERANEISQSYGGETTIEAYFNLGVAYVKLGEYEKAEATFDHLLLDKKQVNLIDYIFYHYGRAQLLARKGQYHEAIDLTMKVLTKIDTWEQTTRIRAEVESFYHELRRKLRPME